MSRSKRKAAAALATDSSPAAQSMERPVQIPLASPCAAPDAAEPPAPAPTTRGYHIMALFLALPFLVFYWCCPFISRLSLGNDYTLYSIGGQMELLYSIRHGSFPLFFPRPADGFTATGLTLGQLFHPITWLAGALPGYWQGYALELNTLLRLLSLGLIHFVLFRFLLRLRLSAVFSLLLSFITVYNLRMLDLLRYGASLENYTAYLLLMIAVGWHYLEPVRIRTFVWMALAAYLLIVGGHPQFMYFGLLGAGVLIPILPFYLRQVLPETRLDGRCYFKFCGQAYLAIAVGTLLATAYWLPFYVDFLRKETIRVGLNYDWAVVNQDTLAGTLNSFFNPWWSDVHGTFGGSALSLLAAGLPFLFLAGVKIPRTIAVLWFFLALTLAYQLGSATPFHHFFWRFVPLASSFRVPGRLAFLNPFTILLLLAWLFRQPSVRLKWLGKALELPPWVLLAGVMAVIFVLYNLLPLSGFLLKQAFYPATLYQNKAYAGLNQIPAVMFAVVFLLGLCSLLLLAWLGFIRRGRPIWTVTLCLVVVLHTIALARYGTWIEIKKKTPTLAEMDARRKVQIGCTAPFANMGEASRMAHEHQARGGGRSDQVALLYSDVQAVSGLDEVYAHTMGGNPWTNLALLENMAPRPTPPPAKTEAKNSVTLDYSSFNRLVFSVDCRRPAALALMYPYMEGRWRATLNGLPVQIYRCNGFAQAVLVPVGKSIVEFRYFSWMALGGLAVSFTVAALLSVMLLSTLRQASWRLGFSLAALCFFAGIFILICYSIYHGQNLGTVHHLTPPAN